MIPDITLAQEMHVYTSRDACTHMETEVQYKNKSMCFYVCTLCKPI